jgi:hypothetical protein
MTSLLIALVRFYKKFLSKPWHTLCGPSAGCRFHPTCSEYCLQCLKHYSLPKAICKSVFRILRCQPWGGSGYDPAVPDDKTSPTPSNPTPL